MKLTHGLKSVALIATISLAAMPAGAQERDHGRGRSSEGQAVQRDRNGETRRSDAPRAQAPRAEAPRPTAAPQAAPVRRAEASRVESRGSGESRASVESRRDGYNRDVYGRSDHGRAVPRPRVIAPRVERPIVVAPRAARPIIVAPRVYAPRYYYGGYYGYRPGYRPYAFRPWTRLSFGIFAGYPVQYVYWYPYAVPVYGYGAPSAPVYITPSSTMYGGITLEISPGNAEVFVDGQYVGQVRDFDGVGAPLNLVAGRHRVDVNAPGYEPLSFDVDVTPGQLVPYRGDMQPVR
jgi:hypothetical protein